MKRYALIALGVAFLAGCGGNGGQEETPLPVPMSVGNWWFYRDSQDTTQEDTIKIVGDTLYNGYNGYLGIIIHNNDTLPPDTFISYYADGFLWDHYSYTADSISFEVDAKTFETDPAVGDTWTVFQKDTTYGGFNLTYTVKAVITAQEDKTVPAGSFQACYKVIDSSFMYVNGVPMGGGTNIYWLAMGVGNVASTTDQDTTKVSELVDYQVQ